MAQTLLNIFGNFVLQFPEKVLMRSASVGLGDRASEKTTRQSLT